MQTVAIWPRIYAEWRKIAENQCITKQFASGSMQNAATCFIIDAWWAIRSESMQDQRAMSGQRITLIIRPFWNHTPGPPYRVGSNYQQRSASMLKQIAALCIGFDAKCYVLYRFGGTSLLLSASMWRQIIMFWGTLLRPALIFQAHCSVLHRF